MAPVSLPGNALSDLLGKPPALALIQHTKTKVPLYERVPATAPARQQFYRDKQLTAVQQKLESTMHLMINGVENPQQQNQFLHTAAAFVRSAFEDLQQQRRGAIAGARRHKLDARPDDDSAKLFSKEEDKMLSLQYKRGQQNNKRYPRQQQRQQQQNQQFQQRSDSAQPQNRRWRSSSKGKGGKGKGRKE